MKTLFIILILAPMTLIFNLLVGAGALLIGLLEVLFDFKNAYKEASRKADIEQAHDDLEIELNDDINL